MLNPFAINCGTACATGSRKQKASNGASNEAAANQNLLLLEATASAPYDYTESEKVTRNVGNAFDYFESINLS